MIAKAAPKRRTGAGSFSSLKRYLERDEAGELRSDCIATWSHAVASDETAAIEMQAVAQSGRMRGTDPVYHLVSSWRPGETITPEIAQAAESAMRRSLGALGHQSFSALHYDEEADRYHMHTAINRVSVTTGKTLDVWQDYARLARGTEWCEREYGLQVDRRIDWRRRVGERDFSLEEIDLDVVRDERGKGVPAKTADEHEPLHATQAARQSRARSHYSWASIMRSEVAVAIEIAAANPATQWTDVHAALQPYGVRLEASGSGLRIVGAEIGMHVKASEIGVDAASLQQRLGPFEPPADVLNFDDRIAKAKAESKTWRSWHDVHRELEAADLGIRAVGGGRGKIVDLIGDRSAPLAQLGASMRELEERLGPFVQGQAMIAREEREAMRRAEGVRSSAALLSADPDLVLGPLMTTQSTWTRVDVERGVRQQLGLARDEESDDVSITTEAILQACEPLTSERTIFSTSTLRNEEQALFEAVSALGEGTSAPKIRAAGDDLDAQQRLAYDHLATPTQIAVVTGVAGAGKSRLQRDLCAAYSESGARVIGIAVAGAAARTLGDEAQIESRTVAKLLSDLDKGRETLTSRDVIFVDEAGTLGSEQGRRLFEHVQKSGATIRLLGDEGQHESVTRGAVLRGLVEDVGAFDMQTTRRAKQQWLRDVARDLRAGKVAPALDALREHGAVRAYATQAEAREALVSEYVAGYGATILENGTERTRSALLLADSNADMTAMNADVQRRLLASGRLGDVATYAGMVGEVEFAIGDTVAIREAMDSRRSASRWVNGDRATVVAHVGDGVMRIRRERDGVEDLWDTSERSGVQLGYAMTSYRSQGSTVDDVLILPAAGRRGTYVDVTRARESVRIAYGTDQVRDFGELMFRAQRDTGKTLVRDVNDGMMADQTKSRVCMGSDPGVLEGRRMQTSEANVAAILGSIATGRDIDLQPEPTVFAGDAERDAAMAQQRGAYDVYLATTAKHFEVNARIHADRLKAIDARRDEIAEKFSMFADRDRESLTALDLLRERARAEQTYQLEIAVSERLVERTAPQSFRDFLAAQGTVETDELARTVEDRETRVDARRVDRDLTAGASMKFRPSDRGIDVEVNGRHGFTDVGASVEVPNTKNREATALALIHASEKFGGAVSLSGADEVKIEMLRAAVSVGVTVSNPELQAIQRQLLEEKAREVEPAREAPVIDKTLDEDERVRQSIVLAVESLYGENGKDLDRPMTIEFSKAQCDVRVEDGEIVLEPKARTNAKKADIDRSADRSDEHAKSGPSRGRGR